MRIALLGNPNCGKTTLFNALTGGNHSVGNWSGVTTALEKGTASFHGESLEIIDLPGIYSLQTAAPEQAVVREFFLNYEIDVLLNVVNCTNLERQLFLSTQLLDLGIPMVIGLNMADLLPSMGLQIDENALEESLGIPCIKISAAKRQGFDVLLSALCKEKNKMRETENVLPLGAEARYGKIKELIESCLLKVDPARDKSAAWDKFFCHRIWGIPIFFLLMLLIFYLSFGPPSQIFTTGFENFCSSVLKPAIKLFFFRIGLQPWLQSLLLEGAFDGVSSILIFLPQLLILFFCLAIMEASGYLARVSFIMDGSLSRFNLSGHSAIPLILACGCSVSGLMACRIIENPEQKRLTMRALPFMSCSAKMPVYAFLCQSFFPKRSWLIIASLYLLGLLTALLTARLSRKKPEEEHNAWILELPTYQLPRWRLIANNVAVRCQDFLSKAGTAVFIASIVLWFLSNFNMHLQPVKEIASSILAQISRWTLPAFSLMGCGQWQIAVAAWAGILSKEMIVASLAVMGVDTQLLADLLSPAAAGAFLIFSMLYTPCIATLFTAHKETASFSFAIKMAARQFLVAWFTASLFYHLMSVLVSKNL